ncbi:MAG TPA: MarR family transcriptional regulator [Solirubrobacteraceae bacterium]|nr:MarR family transcriptional regulator [Solirubrobacteraceae bacterium]
MTAGSTATASATTTASTRGIELEDLANELPRRVSGLARLLYGAAGSTLPRGMRSVLFALSARPLQISQIARQEGIGQSAATRMVARLESLELVRRERSAPDRRVVIVSVTERGRAELEYMREQSRGVMREVLRDLSARELRQLSQASDALELLTGLIHDHWDDVDKHSAQSTRAASSRRNTRRALPS